MFLILMSFGLAACGGGTLAPAIQYGQSSGAGSAGVHTVASGDTLYSVASRYKLPMRDIAILNRMKPPFKLYEGQRLKLPPPQEYRVQHGDTLYGVSRMFDVNSSEVARMNDISSPYILKPGQLLRLPSVVRKVKVASSSSSAAGKTVAQNTGVQSVSVPVVEKTALSTSSTPPPPNKPSQPAIIKDGVPVPQGKPRYEAPQKPIKITKVTTKTPKRSSSKFMRPLGGKIISGFGPKKSGLHNDGINIAAARGTSVKAAENGVVVYVGNALKGSGNLILLRHENQWMTAYAHLDKMSVRKGQTVRRGSVIGKVGSTGSVSTPQLHFEVRRGTSALNPTRYME
tara:strand:- start:4859 stop:5884 length:1026 start_codon:yes stop_codon:yes gene_type:complete